jgi:hypothetical protein
MMLAELQYLAVLASGSMAIGYIVPEASHPAVASYACSGKTPVVEHWVTEWPWVYNSYYPHGEHPRGLKIRDIHRGERLSEPLF